MNTIIVTANLGAVKAYRVVETPTRGRKLELLEAIGFPEAHGHYTDKVTDMAGRFPVSAGVGAGTAMATAETLRAELEIQRRLTRLVAEEIQAILRRERPEWWNFAATSEIHQAILKQMAPALRTRLVRIVPADLTKAPADEVLEHFLPAAKTA